MAITPNRLLTYISSFLFSVALLSIGESLHWSLELIAHFREPLLLASLGGMVFSAFLGSKAKWSLLALLISTVIHCWVLIPFWLNSGHNTPTNTQLQNEHKIFLANIHSGNNQKELLIDYLNTSQDDTVILLEVTKSWGQSLTAVKNFEFSKVIALDSNFGLAVLSRYPIEVLDVLTDRTNWIPHMILKISTSDMPLNLVVIHAFPPIGRYANLIHERHLEVLAKRIEALDGPMLVCGDFNSAPWTRRMQNFLIGANLEYQSNLTTTVRSWPSSLFFPSIPIDFCLAREALASDINIGPDIGSDHKTIQYQFKF